MEKNNREKKRIVNIICRVLTVVSTILAFLFMYFVYKLNLLTLKYFLLIISVILLFYLLFYLINFSKRVLVGFKIFTTIFVILFGAVFSFGMEYVDKTSDFFHSITGDLSQKEEYFVKTLNTSQIKVINNLKGKKIGAYVSADEATINVAKELVNKKIEFEFVKYTDITLMFSDLENGVIDAVLINELIDSLRQHEFNHTSNLKIVYSVLVPIVSLEEAKEVDVTNRTFNVFVAGGDAYGTINKVMNTDVNMVITVDPVKKKLLFTSIPRDYYVNLPSKGEDAYDKLTHAGYYGIQESILAVEKLLDIEINYYVKVNFSTIVDLIDAIGGIEVYSDYAFSEIAYGKYSYKVGINKLNGEQALGFARERYSFKDGDIQRVKNQQKVLSAVVNKVSSSSVIITKYLEILDSVSESFSTNLDTQSINKLVKMQLDEMVMWTIKNQNLTSGNGSTKQITYTFPTLELYVMPQNEESVKAASNAIKNF